MKDQNKRKLEAVIKGLGETVWDTLPLAMAFVIGLVLGSRLGC